MQIWKSDFTINSSKWLGILKYLRHSLQVSKKRYFETKWQKRVERTFNTDGKIIVINIKRMGKIRVLSLNSQEQHQTHYPTKVTG